METKLSLLIVDPQNDFCDPGGSLYIKGATEDIERISDVVRRLKDRWDRIHVTLDTHHLVDVDHPIFWTDPKGNHPAHFTIITVEDVEKGRWSPADRSLRDRMLGYVRALDASGRYPLCIWPPHCLIGSWGHNVFEPLRKALLEWEDRYAMVEYVVKGTNPYTEHYSAVQADVPDDSDPSTLPNRRLIEAVKGADTVVVAGEASSHCLANTVRDLAVHLGEEGVKKLVLLGDCTSAVPGFEREAESFLEEMTRKGMQFTESSELLREMRRTGTG
jgi:nicotinamidase-related amidase